MDKVSSPAAPRVRRPPGRFLAAKYFAISLLLIGGTALGVDRLVLPALEDSNYLESHKWSDENHLINHFIYLRNKANADCPIWRSDGMPVSEAKTKSKRILVMGDSFIWGDGYTNANTLWWKQLEKELNGRGYDDVEVIAAGLCGASTRTELDWLAKLVPAYKPDLVIIGYVTNDPDEVDEWGRHFVWMIPKEHGDHASIFKPLEKLLPNLSGQLRQIHKVSMQKQLNGKGNYFEYADWELNILKGRNFEQYKKTVRDMSAFLKNSNLPAFVLTLPAGFQNRSSGNNQMQSADAFYQSVQSYYSERHLPVKPVFEKAGIPFVDILDDFIASAKKDPSLSKMNTPLRLGINPGNGHPGPFATHFYAVKAADELESKYPQVLGSRSARKSTEKKIAINDWVPPFMGLTARGDNAFEFVYPVDPATQALFMPMRKRHVQFNLSTPASLRNIIVEGRGMSKVEVYGTFEDPKLGYDDGTVRNLGTITSAKKELTVPQQFGLLNSIKLRAHFSGDDRRLSIRLKPR